MRQVHSWGSFISPCRTPVFLVQDCSVMWHKVLLKGEKGDDETSIFQEWFCYSWLLAERGKLQEEEIRREEIWERGINGFLMSFLVYLLWFLSSGDFQSIMGRKCFCQVNSAFFAPFPVLLLLQDILAHQDYWLAWEIRHERCCSDLSVDILHVMVMTALQYQTLRETHSRLAKCFCKTIK